MALEESQGRIGGGSADAQLLAGLPGDFLGTFPRRDRGASSSVPRAEPIGVASSGCRGAASASSSIPLPRLGLNSSGKRFRAAQLQHASEGA